MMPRETQVDPTSSTINNGSFHDFERGLEESYDEDSAVRRHDDNLWSTGIDPYEASSETQHRDRLENMQGGRIAPATTKVLATADGGDLAASSLSSGRFPGELLSLSPPTSSVFSLSPTNNSSKIPTSLSPGAVALNRSNHTLSVKERSPDDGGGARMMMVGVGTPGPHYQSDHPPQQSKIDQKLLLERKTKPLQLASDTLLQLVELSSLSDDDSSAPARTRNHCDLVNYDNGTNILSKATLQSASASFSGHSAREDTDIAMQGIESSYAAFDRARSTSGTSFAKKGVTAIHHHSGGTYETEREARPLYQVGENNHAALGTGRSYKEEPTPVDQAKGASSRPMTTTRGAGRQFSSKMMDHDDHANSSPGRKVEPTMEDKDDDGSSVEIGARREETTRMNAASRYSRNPASTTTAQNVDQWNIRLQELQEYNSQYGHCNVPFCYNDKPFLAAWVKRQRYQYKCKMRGKHSHLTDEREALLEQLGFVWDTHVAAWEENFALMAEFYRQHGHCYVPIKQKELSTWAKRQRRHYKQYQQSPGVPSSTMTEDRIRRLNEIDFPWTTTMRPNTKGVVVKGSSSGNSSFAASQEEFASAPSTHENNITADNEPPSTALGEGIQVMALRTLSAPMSETSTVVTRARAAVRRGRRSQGDGKKVEEKL